MFFQWFEAPEGRKVGSLKRRVAEPSGQTRDEKVHAVCGAKHISKSKCTKHTHASDHFWKLTMFEKVHAVVARSTFPSQNVQNTPCSDVRTTFGSWDVEKVHAVVARSTFPSQNVYKAHQSSDHFWKLRYWKSARRCGAKHISKSKC